MNTDGNRPKPKLSDILANGRYSEIRNAWDRAKPAPDFAPLPAGTY